MSLIARDKPAFYNVPNNGTGTLNAATAGAMGVDTNGVAVLTAGSYGAIVEALVMNTDDTAAVNVFVYILNGATVQPIGIVNVPLSSGNTASAPTINALLGTGQTLVGLPINSQGKQYIALEAGEVLKVSTLANMTAAKKLYATAIGWDASTT
jgi:hypothetical protein